MLINQKTHFPLKCFSLICITLKVLNKVTSLWNKGAVGYNKESTYLKDLMLLLVFSIYQLYQQIKDMKIWQQVLAQQMKPLISPILVILTPRKSLHS